MKSRFLFKCQKLFKWLEEGKGPFFIRVPEISFFILGMLDFILIGLNCCLNQLKRYFLLNNCYHKEVCAYLIFIIMKRNKRNYLTETRKEKWVLLLIIEKKRFKGEIFIVILTKLSNVCGNGDIYLN